MNTGFKHSLNIAVAVLLSVVLLQVAKADVFQVTGGISSGNFVDGVNVTDSQPVLFLGADWSFDNGAFTGAECYESNSERGESLSRGCHLFAGYFSQINENQAITVELRRKEYLIRTGTFWRYFEGSVDWHVNKRVTLSLGATDNWLDQGYSTVSFGADYSQPLTSGITAYGLVDVMKFESTANIGYTEHYELGVKYQKERWNVGLSAIFSDPLLREQLGFSVSEEQLRLTFSYRLY